MARSFFSYYTNILKKKREKEKKRKKIYPGHYMNIKANDFIQNHPKSASFILSNMQI